MTNRADIEQGVAEVLSVILEVELAPGEDLKRDEAGGWDSLKHLELIFAIEERFEIRLDEAEIPELDSACACVEAVARHHAS